LVILPFSFQSVTAFGPKEVLWYPTVTDRFSAF
jgi:hypothetical protein